MEPADRANLPAKAASLLALTDRVLRPADQLDYLIRRNLIPTPHEFRRSFTPAQLRREVQAAIGQKLRVGYDLGQRLPVRLVDLLRQLEGPSGPEAIAQQGSSPREQSRGLRYRAYK